MYRNSMRTEAPGFGTFLNLAPCTSLSGCLFVSFVISCKCKKSGFLSPVPESFLAVLENYGN